MASRARPGWGECIAVGFGLFGLIGLAGLLGLLGGLVAFIRSDTSFVGFFREGFERPVLVAAVLAAGLVGSLAWRLTIRPDRPRASQGALAGLVTGLGSHPLCWLLFSAYAAWSGGIDPARAASGVVFMAVMATFSSVMLLGWMSGPLGLALGYLAAWGLRGDGRIDKPARVEEVAGPPLAG